MKDYYSHGWANSDLVARRPMSFVRFVRVHLEIGVPLDVHQIGVPPGVHQ